MNFTEEEVRKIILELRMRPLPNNQNIHKAADMLEELYDGFKLFISATNKFSEACDAMVEEVLSIGYTKQ